MVNYWAFVLHLSAGLPGNNPVGEICSAYLFDLDMTMQRHAFLVNERDLSLLLTASFYCFGAMIFTLGVVYLIICSYLFDFF